MIRAVCCMLASLLVALAAGVPAQADEMAFYVKNRNERAIALELHGGGGRAWPGGNQVYMIEEKMQKSIPVDCEAGERICYAAWLVGDDATSWGVGPDNTRSCDDCCTRCEAKTTFSIEIVP